VTSPADARTVSSNLQIAQAARLRPIADIAADLGIERDELESYGPFKAKVSLSILDRLRDRPDGREIVVTAMTPTPFGEGKTTTTIGLAQALNRIGVRAAPALRQPSLGPIFGVKGGGAGGGYSQVVPMEDINLHFTGDLHAVTAAHNLAAAFLDNHLFRGNALGIETASIGWPRVLDVDDRSLRHVRIGIGESRDERESAFHITAASEVMAILALATDLDDLRRRIGRASVGQGAAGQRVTLEDLKVAGAMTALMRDALKPNLVQTLEGGPAFVHAGPFANIAHGNSSVVADRVALKLLDAVCTESGFGSDMGFQKFVDIKCRQSGLRPSAAVIVATVRALRMHGQAEAGATPGDEDEELRLGCRNLAQHVRIVGQYGVPAVVAINAFSTDRERDHQIIRAEALAAGASDAVLSTHYRDGGAGGEALARAVWAAAQTPAANFQFLYPDDARLVAKIDTIARSIYGADGTDVSPQAEDQLARMEEAGYGSLPICMAKTQASLSHDPTLKGRPMGFRVPIRDARLYAGAGFVTAYCGDILTMPGLPTHPAGEAVDVDADGRIVGLF
jgi:formate--tetrahydrofolate ligase